MILPIDDINSTAPYRVEYVANISIVVAFSTSTA